MDKQIVNELVKGIIVEKITQMFEDTTSNEFLEMVSDKIYKETGMEFESLSEVQVIVEKVLFPIYYKVLSSIGEVS